MKLSVEEDADNRLMIGSEDRNHTLLNLLKQAVWDVGGQAGYDKGHPYTGESTLVITDDDPQTTLEDAVDHARKRLDTFEDAFKDA